MEHNQADRSRTWTTIAIIYSSNQKSGHEKRELHLFDFFRNVLILWDLPFWNIAFVSSQHFYASDTPIKNNSFLLWMHYRSLALDWNLNDCKNVGYCGASMSKLPSLYCYCTHNYFWNYTFFFWKSQTNLAENCCSFCYHGKYLLKKFVLRNMFTVLFPRLPLKLFLNHLTSSLTKNRAQRKMLFGFSFVTSNYR